MSHDDAFLQAIIADPDDDAPRLLYADWLDERGDPRGEFIRVQCALARMDEYDPRRWDLMARERELLAAHRPAWLGTLADCSQAHAFHRGFLDSLTIRAEAFLAADVDVICRAPLPELQFVAASGLVPSILQRLAAQPLKRLAFKRQPFAWGLPPHDALTSTDVEALASSPILAHLTSLAFQDQIWPEGVRRLTAAPGLAGLRRLALHKCSIGAAGVEAIAECLALGGLTTLEITGTLLSTAPTQALAQSRALGNLRRLCLSGNDITAQGAAALAVSPRLGSLEQLDLSSNPLGDAGAIALAKSPHLLKVRDLRLARTRITASGVRALLRSGMAQRLTRLDHSGNPIGCAGASAFGEASLPALSRLDLSGNEIGDDGAKALAASKGLAGLRILRLGANGLRVWGVKEIASSPHLCKLHTLDLHSNRLDDRGLQVLARWPGLARLAVLDLHKNMIGDVGVEDLACSPYLGGLRVVDLHGNGIGPEGTAALRRSPLSDSRRVDLRLDLLDALEKQPPLLTSP